MRLYLDKCEPPCWNGINPGATTIDEAKQLLNERFGSANYAEIGEGNSSLHIYFYRSEPYPPCLGVHIEGTASQPKIVKSMMFLFTQRTGCPTYSLSDMILLFGTPDYMVQDLESYSPQMPMIIYAKPNTTGIWIMFKYYPSWGVFLDVIEFYCGDSSVDPAAKIDRWQGITRFNR